MQAGARRTGHPLATIDEISGFSNPLIDKPDLPTEIALRVGWELAIAGQAEKSAWFYFAGEPNSLFYRDASGNITHCYSRSTGETTEFPKSSVSDFVERRTKAKEDFENAVRAGRAI